MCGTVPEEIKIVDEMDVLRSADGLKPGAHVAGAAKALVASIKRREEPGDEYGLAV